MYYQVLILASFIVAGYQDIRYRAVADLVWIPAALGLGLLLAGQPSHASEVIILASLFAGIGIAFLVSSRFTGLTAIGEADAIMLPFLAANTNYLNFLINMVFIGVSTVIIIGVLHATGRAGKPRKIPLKQFLEEPRWVPKAVFVGEETHEVATDVNLSRDEVEKFTGENVFVEVSYGVPQVTYFAIGYLLYVLYLIAFQPSTFFAFP